MFCVLCFVVCLLCFVCFVLCLLCFVCFVWCSVCCACFVFCCVFAVFRFVFLCVVCLMGFVLCSVCCACFLHSVLCFVAFCGVFPTFCEARFVCFAYSSVYVLGWVLRGGAGGALVRMSHRARMGGGRWAAFGRSDGRTDGRDGRAAGGRKYTLTPRDTKVQPRITPCSRYPAQSAASILGLGFRTFLAGVVVRVWSRGSCVAPGPPAAALKP